MDLSWETLRRDFGSEGIVFVSLRGRRPCAEGKTGDFFRRLSEITLRRCAALSDAAKETYLRDPDPKKRFRQVPILVRIFVTQEGNSVLRQIRILHGAEVILDRTFRDEFSFRKGKSDLVM